MSKTCWIGLSRRYPTSSTIPNPDKLFDPYKIDFEELKDKFKKGCRRTEVESLRLRLSPSRFDFLELFEQLIEKYNAASLNIEVFFAELIKLTQELTEEEQWAMRAGVSEEELAVFDILTRPEPELSDTERAEMKKVCKAFLETLKAEKLVLD